MIKKVAFFAVLLAIVVVLIRLVTTGPLTEGDYLSEDYIHVLTTSHSALKAFKEAGADAKVWARRYEDGTLVFHLMPFFHHVDKIFVLNQQEQLIRNDFEGFQKLSKDSFSITTNSRTIVYHRVDSEDNFLRSKTISGSYSDSAGQKYTFTVDGKAIYPDRSYDYVVQNDFVESRDYDMLLKKRDQPISSQEEIKTDFFFVVSGSELKLYRLKADEPWWVPEAEPFITLKKND